MHLSHLSVIMLTAQRGCRAHLKASSEGSFYGHLRLADESFRKVFVLDSIAPRGCDPCRQTRSSRRNLVSAPRSLDQFEFLRPESCRVPCGAIQNPCHSDRSQSEREESAASLHQESRSRRRQISLASRCQTITISPSEFQAPRSDLALQRKNSKCRFDPSFWRSSSPSLSSSPLS